MSIESRQELLSAIDFGTEFTGAVLGLATNELHSGRIEQSVLAREWGQGPAYHFSSLFGSGNRTWSQDGSSKQYGLSTI